MHKNSVASWRELIAEGVLGKRHSAIMKTYLDAHPRYLTDREVLQRLRLADMNQVRPRITELSKFGALEESVEVRRDPFTGRRVRALRAVEVGSENR